MDLGPVQQVQVMAAERHPLARGREPQPARGVVMAPQRRIDRQQAVAQQPPARRAPAALQRGIHQYRQILEGRARIDGIRLVGSTSPLVR